MAQEKAYGTLPAEAACPGTPVHEQVAPIKTTADDARKNYDRLACIYDCWSCWERPYLRAGLASLNPQPGEKCLEIGCGTGSLLPALAERVTRRGEVVAVDISSKMLKRAESRLARKRRSHNLAPVHFVCADVGAPQGLRGTGHGDPGTYDAAIATFVLELFPVEVTKSVLAEVRRLLKPTGRLCVVAMSAVNPNKHSWGMGDGSYPVSKRPQKTCATRFYELCHRWFPKTVDCRPIYCAATLAAAGFCVEPVLDRATQASVKIARTEWHQTPYGTQLLPMYGLNVEVICCCKRGDVDGGGGEPPHQKTLPRVGTMEVKEWAAGENGAAADDDKAVART